MVNRKGKANALGFAIEIIGAALISIGAFSIPLRFFGSAPIAELVIAVGTLLMAVGRLLR